MLVAVICSQLKFKNKMQRKTLIKICQDAVVHHTKWMNRDSFICQKGIQSIYKGLTAGLKFKILTKENSPDYHSNKETIIIQFTQIFDEKILEKGLHLEISSREDYFKDCCPDFECEMFDSDGLDFTEDWVCQFMPTRKRLKDVGIGNDWY